MEAGHELPKSWVILGTTSQDFCQPPQRVSYYYYNIYFIYIYIYTIYTLSWELGYPPYSQRERGEDHQREAPPLPKFPRFHYSVHNTGLLRHRTAMIVSTYERLWVGAHTLCRPLDPTPGCELHLRVPGSRLRLVGALVEVHKLPAVAVLPVQLCSLPDS